MKRGPQALLKVKKRQFVGSISKKFQTAKVLIMERPSVELAVIFMVRNSLNMGPLKKNDVWFLSSCTLSN